MDPETKRRIEEKVLEVLRTADMNTVTELKVREAAAISLGIALSDMSCKKLVREVIEGFLLSIKDDDEEEDKAAERCVEGKNPNSPGEKNENGERLVEANRGGDGILTKKGDDREFRFICELSNKRSVALTDSGQEKAILIGEFYWKDGKRVPGSKGISLTSEQWPEFRKSLPAIEEAIKVVLSRTRSRLEQNQIQMSHGKPAPDDYDMHHGPELKKQKVDKPPSLESARKQVEKRAASCSSHPQGLNPIEIFRFDGKNYHDWAKRMELFLNQLDVAYVLSSPCPSAMGVATEEIPLIMSSAQKWMDDDYICRINILNSLSDPLFDQYSKKTGHAKDLWEELKHVYISNEHGTKVSLVNKYVEFKMIEGKSVVEQVKELHDIAGALVPHGMYVEKNFHVNVIIAKLPPSWKDMGIRLMKENNLSFWMLMDMIRLEEENRRKGEKDERRNILHNFAESQKARKGHIIKPGLIQKRDVERERRVWSCTICKKKGHPAQQCWFRNSENLDSTCDRVNGSVIKK